MKVLNGKANIAGGSNLILRAGGKTPFISGRQRQRHIALRFVRSAVKSDACVNTPLLIRSVLCADGRVPGIFQSDYSCRLTAH